jgi:hypothetical protein
VYVIYNATTDEFLVLPENPNREGAPGLIKPFRAEWHRDVDNATRFEAEGAAGVLNQLPRGLFRAVRMLSLAEALALDKPNGQM